MERSRNSCHSYNVKVQWSVIPWSIKSEKLVCHPSSNHHNVLTRSRVKRRIGNVFVIRLRHEGEEWETKIGTRSVWWVAFIMAEFGVIHQLMTHLSVNLQWVWDEWRHADEFSHFSTFPKSYNGWVWGFGCGRSIKEVRLAKHPHCPEQNPSS